MLKLRMFLPYRFSIRINRSKLSLTASDGHRFITTEELVPICFGDLPIFVLFVFCFAL